MLLSRVLPEVMHSMVMELLFLKISTKICIILLGLSP